MWLPLALVVFPHTHQPAFTSSLVAALHWKWSGRAVKTSGEQKPQLCRDANTQIQVLLNSGILQWIREAESSLLNSTDAFKERAAAWDPAFHYAAVWDRVTALIKRVPFRQISRKKRKAGVNTHCQFSTCSHQGFFFFLFLSSETERWKTPVPTDRHRTNLLIWYVRRLFTHAGCFGLNTSLSCRWTMVMGSLFGFLL